MEFSLNLGQVKNTAKEVAYAADAVVSKTLIKQPKGTVTLFAFDKGQGLSEHTAPYDAMVQILDGEAEITVGGKLHVVKAGEFIIMPATISHALDAKVPFKMMLTMIKA